MVRQTNSPESQRLVGESSRKLSWARMNLDEAWNFYESGNREFIFEFIKRGNFDANHLIGGGKSLLIEAVARGDLELVQEVLEIPGVDVNFMGNSGFLPIQLSFPFPEVFDALLLADVNLLARNAFGSNPIEQALKEGRLDLAERMLRRAERQNEDEGKEIERLVLEFWEKEEKQDFK